MIFPLQSTPSAPGNCFFILAESPTAAIRSPSVTTVAFHRTWLSGPKVTTIPFSNRMAMIDPFSPWVFSGISDTGREGSIFLQGFQFLRKAYAHADRAHETLLCTDRAANAARWIRLRHAGIVENNRQVRTAGTISTGGAQVIVEIGDLFHRRERHEVRDRVRLGDPYQFTHRTDAPFLHQEGCSGFKLMDDPIPVFGRQGAELN